MPQTLRDVSTLELSSPIVAIDRAVATRRTGVRTKGPPAAEVLSGQLGIRSVAELLHHYPRRYIDRTQVARIRELRLNQQATVIARVRRVRSRPMRNRRTMVTVTVSDGSGYLDLTFFNQPWLAKTYREGHELAVSGVVQLYRGRLQLAKQEVELLRGDESDLVHTGRITPIHPATEGITTRTIRELIWRARQRPRRRAGAPPARPRPAALTAVDAGHQAAVMAPTEVLAGQHLRSFEAFLAPIGAVRYLEVAGRRSSRRAQASLLASEEDPATLTYALLTD